MRRRVPRGLMPAVTRVGILRTQGRSSKTQGICDDNCDSPFRHITIWVVGGERRAFSHVRAFVIWWQCKQSTRALIGSSGKTLWTFAKLRFITKTCFFQSLLLLIIAAVLQFPPGDDDRCYLGHHSLNSDNFPNFHLELFETILPLMCFSCAHGIDIILFFLQESKGCAWSSWTSPWMRTTCVSSGEKVPHVSHDDKRSNRPPPRRSLICRLRVGFSYVPHLSTLNGYPATESGPSSHT